MADEYSRALFYDYEKRCEPVDDASGSFWCSPCGRCGITDGCGCYRCGTVLGNEIGLPIIGCDGVQVELVI